MHDLKQELVISAEIFLQQPKRSVSNTGKKTSEDIGTCSSILGRYGKLKHFAVSVKLFERISNAIPFPSRQTKRRVLWDKSRGEHPDLQWRLPTWVYGCCIGGKNHAMCICHCRTVGNALSWSQSVSQGVICDIHLKFWIKSRVEFA